MAEKYRNWEWYDFFLDVLRSDCCCFGSKEGMGPECAGPDEEDLVDLGTDNPQDDRGPHNNEFILNGKSGEEVKQIVSDSCLYDSAKRLFKYRQWAEPQHEALFKISRHVYALMTRTRKVLANPKVM